MPSGKGGIVRHVFSQGDPMGIHYHGFGKPAAEELRPRLPLAREA